jgi:pyruvate/2-oxoglutarate/acetoin dehydrogenase E1 component
MIQFREAICEAMSEEMRQDESIYLMGEEVAGIMVLTRHRKVCLLSLVQKEH